MRPSIPLTVDLWDIVTVAQYVKRDTKLTQERIVVLPDFPKAIRLAMAKSRVPTLPSPVKG